MATDEFGEKTEQPTEHRRTEARQKGNVARSQDLNAAALMLAAALILWFFGLPVFRSLSRLTAASLKTASVRALTIPVISEQFRSLFEHVLLALGPLVLLTFGTAVLINILQVGVLVTPEAVSPKLSRLSPVEGFKRLFSIRSVMRLMGSLAKFTITIVIAGLFITSSLPLLMRLTSTGPAHLLSTVHSTASTLAFQLAFALIALALLDFSFQKWKHEQDLKMTKHEVREEMKQLEGDPHIRQRRRESHKKLAQARELQQVAGADVVLRNPTHVAVALKYDPQTMPAPTVVAKGADEMARRILQIASEHDVPVIERREIARALYKTVPVGRQIPVEMYEVFVEIMAYVYRLTGRTPPGLTQV